MAIGIAVALLGCLAGDGTGMAPPPPPPPPPPGGVSFAADIQPIFTASCALTNCHVGPNPAGPGLNLSEGQTRSTTVDIPSSQVTRLLLIEPGNADSSYLIIKLDGNQSTVGGFGGTMPINANPLDQATIDLIRAWIDAGAEDN
jgi:hypothetical protein